MPSVRKSDIDKERARLEAAAEKHPELKMLLRDLPKDYDPEKEKGTDTE